MNKLYVVGTPIGNIKDITERQKEVLTLCAGIITENQVTTKKLFKLLNIDYSNKTFFTYADFNESKVYAAAIEFVKEHENTALVSEAGTPLISDPGYKIISELRENHTDNIKIEAIPGISSITTHLSISGLPTDTVMYIGFLPKKPGKCLKIIEGFAKINEINKCTFLILESKYRILKTLELLRSKYPNATISLGNELTKMHEKVFYGNIDQVMQQLSKPKGEYIIHLKI